MAPKNFILALISLFFINTVFAQDVQIKGRQTPSPDYPRQFTLTDSVPARSYDGFFGADRVIFKIDHKGNKLTANYFKINDPTNHLKDSLYIPFKSFVAVSEWKRGLEASIINIPFKIRPKTDTIPSMAIANIKNIGLFLGSSFISDRYFYNGKSTRHKFTIGGFLAPNLISLSASNTGGVVDDEISQLGLSVGGGINYTYRSVSFILIPIGFDVGLTSQSKNWIYNKKYWFGFGIGIDATLLSF